MKKYIAYLVIFILAVSFLVNYTKDDSREIPNIEEPEQYDLSIKQKNDLKIVKDIGDWKILYIPLAHYKITARVLASTSYIYGLDAVVAPHDIGVAWGKLKEDNEYTKIRCHHEYRKIVYYQPADYDGYYTQTHIGNIHLIPKNNEILKKIKKLRRGDIVYLTGYLVRAEGLNMKTNEQYERQSSLTRADTGNGACESMYVTDIIYHHKKLFNKKTK